MCKTSKRGCQACPVIIHSPELYKTQIKIKEDKFRRQKEKGNKTLRKRKSTILPSDRGWVKLIPPSSGVSFP